ncbi:MAG: hypothetical protein ACE37K_21975 [Planctomycetota bacterium]
MLRTLPLFGAACLLAAHASAQCFSASGTSIAGQMTATTIYTVDDEGISPDLAFGFPFPLDGTNWTHFVVSSNGEIYLTDGTGAVGSVLYGVTNVNALRGVAGDSPRICGFAGDLTAVPNLASWDVLVDSSVAGEVKVTWVGVRHYLGGEDWNMSVKMNAAGIVEFDYEGNFGTPGIFDITGISAGDGVGAATTPSSDLDQGADSGTLALLYETGWANGFDLNGKGLTIIPNGQGGFTSLLTCGSARHDSVGAGCYDVGRASFYQWFTDAGVASATLTGNAINLAPTGDGYLASWLPGIAQALYVPPSANATNLPVLNDDEVTFTPATGFPIPGGTVNELTVQGNGIVAFGAGPTEPTVDNWIPSPERMLDAYHGGVYFWHAYNEEENGDVWAEELNGTIYITFQDVENFPLGVANPSTWQLQINQATGDMFLLFVSIDSDNNPIFGIYPQDHLIGFTPPGASVDPGPVDLATGLPVVTSPDVFALAMSASPAPISTTSTGSTVDYTVANSQEITPSGGIAAGIVALSLTSGNLDLTGVGAPGCFAYVGGLDLTLPFVGPVGQPHTASLQLPPGLPQGLMIYAQAACLSDGVNAFGILTSNGIESRVGPN